MTNEDDDKKPVTNADKLNDIFNIEPVEQTQLPAVQEQKLPSTVKRDDQQVDEDFNTTRDTLLELEFSGKTVLDHFITIAKDSESPRAIEVLGNFMKTLSDISMSKLDIHEKKKKIKQTKDDVGNLPGAMKIENANIIVGTTADILKQTDKN